MGRSPLGHHPGIHCDKSGQNPIVGWRFNLRGHDFDLCEEEFNKLSAKEKSLYDKIAPPAAAPPPASAPAPAVTVASSQSASGGPTVTVTFTQTEAPGVGRQPSKAKMMALRSAAQAESAERRRASSRDSQGGTRVAYVDAEYSSRRVSEDSLTQVMAASLAEVAARREQSAEEKAAMALALSLSQAEVAVRRETSAEEQLALALAMSQSQADLEATAEFTMQAVRAHDSLGAPFPAQRCSATAAEYEVQPVRAAQEQKLFVTVPEGAAAGTVLQATCPDGTAVQITVPEGVPAGTQLEFSAPPSPSRATI